MRRIGETGSQMTKPVYLPPSANGWCLIVTRPLASWYIVAGWPAAAFSLIFDECDDETPIRPMLYHSETEESPLPFGTQLTADFRDKKTIAASSHT
jgi:hypothetical protein